MSHIVTIETQIRDETSVRAACRRLQLPAPEVGSFRLYSSQVEGLAVQLPGWRYPLVCQPESGQLRYDNFQGHWGEQSQLDRFMQAYAVEKTKLEARRRGHTVIEQPLADGSIKLTVHVGEGA